MTTIYTAQGKVLKNTATDKWLIKPITPPTPPVPVFDEVTIGSQTWMSKNLAIDDGGEGIYTQTVNYGQGDVVEYYYTWDAAVRVAASIPGWHLPTKDEWDALANAVGGIDVAGTKLKSTTGWSSGNGTDDFGFAAFPVGFRSANGTFLGLGNYEYFWTSTVLFGDPYCRYFKTGTSMNSLIGDKSYGYSLRLIKDAA